MRETLLSVGVDIGTSTTQIVFSNITLENLAADFSVPHIAIVDKEITYRGHIHFTPLCSPTEIDMVRVREILAEEYRKSGLKKEDVKTGAVVITGETARKENAGEVLLHLSEFAGDFVVATAGPELESIIAAKGAGADDYARRHMTTAANYDIGGGTSNFAMFKNGELICTGCLDIGGRLIKVDPGTKKIIYIAPKIKRLIEEKRINLSVGDEGEIESLQQVVTAMVELLEMSLGLREKSGFYPEILTLPERDISLGVPVENLCFSGGVADFIYHENVDKDVFQYGDIGILLGQAVRTSGLLGRINRFRAGETIRATVVGAGSHITEISGSTINYDETKLPIKNLPILKLSDREAETGEKIAKAIEDKLGWFGMGNDLQWVAVAMRGEKNPGFVRIMDIAEGIIKGALPIISNETPLVVVLEHDMAKVLGQTLHARMNYRYPVICVDAIKVDNGDYIDIGLPAAGGNVLPVAIKTLVFM